MNYEIEVKPYPTELSWYTGKEAPHQSNDTYNVIAAERTISFHWYDAENNTGWGISPEKYGRLWTQRKSYNTFHWNSSGYQWVTPYHSWHRSDSFTYRQYGPPWGWADCRDLDPEFFKDSPFSEKRWWWFARHIWQFAQVGRRPHMFLGAGSPVAFDFTRSETSRYLYQYRWLDGQYPGFDYDGAPNEAETIPRPTFKRPFGNPQIFKDIHALLVDAQPDIMADVNPPKLWDKKWFYRAVQTLQAGWNYYGTWTSDRHSITDYYFDQNQDSPLDHNEGFVFFRWQIEAFDLPETYPIRIGFDVWHSPIIGTRTVYKLGPEVPSPEPPLSEWT